MAVIRNQLLEVAASGRRNRGADGGTVVVNVVGWRLENHSAGGFAGINGNHLAVGQGHCDRGVSDVGQRRGVRDLPTFGDRSVVCRQRHGGGIDRVGNRGGRRISVIRDQLLEVATRCGGDGRADRRTVVVNVVGGRLEDYGTGGFARVDGNDLAVGQRHGHRRVRFVRKRGGVGDLTAFGNGGVGGAQLNGRGVDRVGDGGHRWMAVIRNQFLEVAASSGADGGTDRRSVVVNIVGWCLEYHGTGGFACVDGDDLSVRQSHGYRRVSFVAQGRGVGDLAAFGDRGIGGRQRHSSGVDRIRNDGGRRISVIRNQLLKVTASSRRNRGADGGTVVVNVVDWCLENHSAGGFTCINGNDLAVG